MVEYLFQCFISRAFKVQEVVDGSICIQSSSTGEYTRSDQEDASEAKLLEKSVESACVNPINCQGKPDCIFVEQSTWYYHMKFHVLYVIDCK